MNGTTLYGEFFLRDGQENISYKHSHSLEGGDISICKEQIEEYMGMINHKCDKIIAYVGEIISENC